MARTSGCGACGFENPRAFRSCARCGASLVDDPRKSIPGTRSGNTFGRMRIAGGTNPSAQPVLVSHEVQLARGEESEIPLVGQTNVTRALQTAIERAFALGAPTVTVLEGARGSGKSRLLFLASQHAAHLDPRVHLAYGSCREDRDGEYAPFSRMLLERFGVTPSSVPSHVRAQMSTIVSSALATSNVISVAETTHLLGYVAGVPFPDSPFLRPLQANPDELHRRAVAAVRRLYGGDASQRPVLLLLDNFHFAEKPAWDMVAELSRIEGPLAIVLAGDAPVAERAQSMRPLGGVHAVPIEALSEEHVGEVVRKLLPDLDELPEPLVAALTHRSSGNPSLLRELAFALWENGLFVRSGPRLRVDLARLRDEDMPVSMDDAIRARLARLDGIERATVDRAAVVGEVFWDGAVLAQMRSEQKVPGSSKAPLSIWLDDFDADSLEDALYRLVDKGFLEPSEGTDLPGAREYRFALPGTRKLVYQEMDAEQRTRRHSVVARWLAVVPSRRWSLRTTSSPASGRAPRRPISRLRWSIARSDARRAPSATPTRPSPCSTSRRPRCASRSSTSTAPCSRRSASTIARSPRSPRCSRSPGRSAPEAREAPR